MHFSVTRILFQIQALKMLNIIIKLLASLTSSILHKPSSRHSELPFDLIQNMIMFYAFRTLQKPHLRKRRAGTKNSIAINHNFPCQFAPKSISLLVLLHLLLPR